MKKLFSLGLMLCINLTAQIPTYYNSIDFTQAPASVKAQLENLVRETQLYNLTYTPQVWYALKDIDLDPDNAEDVLLIYGYNDSDNQHFNDRTRDKDLSCHTTNCPGLWNREHVYPRSIGGFDYQSWPGTDIHALRACDADFNEFRGNSPFGPGSGNAEMMLNSRFYPGDEWKGDVARMIMYMYIRYPSSLLPNYVGDSPHTYHQDMPDIFLEWNAEDPPAEFEIRRNNLIAQDYQGNRNPFIDNPFLATYIWGGPMATNTWESLEVEDFQTKEFQVYPNPTQDYISYQEEFDQILIYNFQGQLLFEDKDLSDYKTNLPQNSGLYFVKFCNQGECHSVKVYKK